LVSERATRFALTLNARNLDRYSREKLARRHAPADRNEMDQIVLELFHRYQGMTQEQFVAELEDLLRRFRRLEAEEKLVTLPEPDAAPPAPPGAPS